MKNSALVCLLGLAAIAGCSSADPKAGNGSRANADPAADAVITISSDETWSDGKRVAGQVTIESGATVTIAPGARISVANGALVTIKGSLLADSASKHAKMVGDAWTGLVLTEGGTLSLSGVEIENARAALDVQGGTATFDDGVVSWSSTPFRVNEGATLSMTRSNVVQAQGLARVKGTFKASHVDFETIADSGIVVDAAGAKASIEDSKLHGKGAPTDVVVVSAGAVHIAYTDISDAHCGLHFWNVNEVDISNVSIHDVSFGAMLYGSQGSKLSIVNSNFERAADLGIEETDGATNGPISVRGCFFGENATDARLQANSQISIVERASSPVPQAGPR